MDVVEKMAAQVRYSIGEPMVVDTARFCLGTLPEGRRRDKTAILGAVYDWCRGVWAGGSDKSTFDAPEKLIGRSLAPVFADAKRLSAGESISISRPSLINGSELSAAILAATMAAAVGIKSRLRFGGDASGWKGIWAEADPLGTDKESIWGYPMDLAAHGALGEERNYEKVGTADIFDAYLADERDRRAPTSDAPPADGEHFRIALPDTWDGVKYELKVMVDRIRSQSTDELVVATAKGIVNGIPPELRNDARARIDAVYAWIKGMVLYCDDPWGLEVIETPNRMIRMGQMPPEVLGAILCPVYAARLGVPLAEIEIKPHRAFILGDCDEHSEATVTLLSSPPVRFLDGTPESPRIVDARLRLGGSNCKPGMHHVWSEASPCGEEGCAWNCCQMDSTEPEYDVVGKHPEMEKSGYVVVWP